MRNFKFIPILLILFVAFVASNSFADKPTKESFVLHWPNANFWNPCAGEVIAGDLDFRVIIHYDKNGDKVSEHWNVVNGVLVGQTSGDVYKPHGPNHWTFDHNPSKGANTSSSRMLIHSVAPGGKQIKFFVKAHTTVNANGETTAVIDSNTWGGCK